ncbi:hypothetical protein F0U59_09465 [Archangium gephyra]|nr:hypothetical protein F0U59_09465 [Archangium gephyra]
MCSLMSVINLNVDGMSSWGGELAGGGTWETSTYANSVYLEISVDGTPPSTQKIPGTYDSTTGTYRGNWSFSAAGMTCGSHTVVVKAFPRNLNSAGQEEICTGNTPVTRTQSVVQACPTASLSCSTSFDFINCTGSASGGTSGYTPLWQTSLRFQDGSSNTSAWEEGGWTNGAHCLPVIIRGEPMYQQYFYFKVRDSSGVESPARSYFRNCSYP